MPEQFDFSKIKDQKKFEELPKEEKDKVVTGAEEEAVVIQENIGKGKEPEVETAEKELSPEVIEKIIEKVQDINQKNTAVHVLTACFSSVPEKIQTDYTDDDRQRDKDLFKTAKTVPHYIGALKGVIKEGLLGTEYGHRYPRTTKELEEAKIRLSGTIKERWLRDVRKRGPTVVFFNIIGRDINSVYGSGWFHSSLDQIAVIFSLESFKEEVEEAQKYLKSRKPPVDRMFYNYLEEADGGNVKFKTHHFGTQGAHSLDEESRPRQRLESEGFALNFRVAPRWLRGIIFRVDRKPTREEIKKSWEDFNAQNLKNFPWEKPIALDEEFIRVYAPKTIINKEKETNEKRAKEIAQAMLSSTQDSNKFLPIYDIYGNLWWPKQMNYEEVKKFVEERDKDKIDPETSSG